jgi:hypothetical protein
MNSWLTGVKAFWFILSGLVMSIILTVVPVETESMGSVSLMLGNSDPFALGTATYLASSDAKYEAISQLTASMWN